MSDDKRPQPPYMAAYGRHILICGGEFCDPQGRAQSLYAKLAAMLGELGRYENPQRVKRGITECLGVCAGGGHRHRGSRRAQP